MKTRLIILLLAVLMLMASPVMALADCDSIIVKQDGLTKRCMMCDGVLRCPY